jgi:hypothetical protein
VRFLLAAKNAAIPLVLCRAERADRGAELLDLATILRPVSSALRGNRAIIVTLRLLQELRGRA